MKMSAKTEYALKTLIDLAIYGKGSVTRIADIAKRQTIPVKFLEQILLTLKSADIVGSQRGVKGGYFLALPPSQISLASIVGLTDDSILSASSPLGKAYTGKQVSPFSEVWSDINNSVREKLEKVSIQDMCDRLRELQNVKISEYFI
ncbi:MAG: hypothetical protein A2283_19130 [Lentisphaerae bacterium RIFOXYA12_FULL_48_11]|nr:MAG: hypothetical protein A2283_19130 [Lentisphaerae bacterium RIFOXYA12_FULL_48_11]